MKKLFTLIFTALLCSSLHAQVSLNPNDVFYKDAKNWETKGVIRWLPQIRPYSVETVKSILQTVKENGDEEDVKKAESYEVKYFSKPWNVGLTVGDNLKLSSSENIKDMFYIEPEVFGDMTLLNIAGFSYKLGILAQNKSVPEKYILPEYYNSRYETHDDPFTVGKAVANIDMGANLTVGKPDLYGMIGVNKIAYGPFINDSVMLNGTQFHSGNFSFIYEGEKWGYTQTFSALSRAVNNTASETSDFVPEKYMAFHSIRFTPIKQFAVSYFESSVYTNRFDPCYFIPVPYMVLQGMYGASDNTISGLTFDVRPIDRLAFSLSGIIDDINLDGFAKGQFDTRFKFALMAGLNFVPEVSFIDNISLDYTIVTPYTYSHCEPSFNIDTTTDANKIEGIYNKDNYTTRLTNLGTRLPPNSDRLQFAVSFAPVERLRLDFSSVFIRHANIAEGFTDEEAKKYLDANNALAAAGSKKYFSTDGSIWTSSLTAPSRDFNSFMRQEHKMYVLQCALNAEYELERMKAGSLMFDFGYMFEYIYNKGVDLDIYRKGDSVAQAKQVWLANLHNVFNNYFSASVKYYY